MVERIRAALDAAGYENSPATVDELRICFLEYAAAGVWRDLCHEDAAADVADGTISTADMCAALRRL